MSDHPMPAAALRHRDIVRYGLPGLALAMLGIPLFLFVPPLFIDVLGLAAAPVGLALLLARLLDVLVDPAAGHWCRTAGRVRQMLAVGALVLLAGAALLFLPPADAGVYTLFAGALLAYLGWTLVAVPLYALGAALPERAADRARLAVSREGFVIAGTLLALGVPVAAGVVEDIAATVALLWWLLLVLLPLSVAALWPLAVRARWDAPQPWAVFLSRSAALYRDREFRGLLGAYFLNAMANGIPATLLVLYAVHVLDARASLGWFLGAYLAAGLLALPAWLWLARRVGEARAWLMSMLWAAAVFSSVPFLGAGDVLAFALVCAATGLSVGADNALPAAMQAAVAERLRARAGGDDAGLVFGWWGMATKLALAAGAAVGLVAVDLGGFDAAAPDADGRLSLALAYSVLPVVVKLLASALVWRSMHGQKGGGTCVSTGC